MGKREALSRRIGLQNIYGLFLAFSCMTVVFAPVLAKYSGLISPDSMPFFSYTSRTNHFEAMLAGGAFTPHNLFWLILHPLYAHELTYIVNSLVLTFGAVYYLRGQRLHPLAAWLGGLALGLCGYTFTLFNAGHRGYFYMFSCAVWAFGLIARGFETRRLVYFALLGLVFAWGMPYQPDVLLFVGALAAAYAIWLTLSRGVAETRRDVQSAIGNGQYPIPGLKSRLTYAVLRVWPRFAVALAVLVLAGFAGIRSAVTTQIVNRDAQIAGASGKAAQSEEPGSEEKTEAGKRDRWIFATNWSLPPEDMLEFLVPGVFGNDSGQPPYPYWGRLGRPHASVFQKGRMAPNYRQHTVYLGIIPLLFAIFAVFAWFSCRRTKEPLSNPAGVASQSSVHHSSLIIQNYADLPFWCGVWLVCLLLAMGRYTPLYRIIYALPYMDYIRAPVKFLHLVEIATAFLSGFGMDMFLRAEHKDLRRKLLRVAVVLAVILLAGSLVVVTARPAIMRHISELGMAQFAEALGGYAVRNFARATGMAVLVAVAVWAVVSRFPSGRARQLVGCCFMGLLCLDQATVARRYVRAMDLGPLYRENAVVKALRAHANGRVPNVVNYATQNAHGYEWFSSALGFNGIRNLAPSAQDMGGAYGRLFNDLQKDPVRLWRILGAQAVIIPLNGVEGLVRGGILRPLLIFELGNGVVRQVQQPGEKTFVLAALPKAETGPRFITDWQGDVPEGKQAEVLVNGHRSVSDAPMIAEGMAAGGARVDLLAERGLPGAIETRVTAHVQVAGLLVFHERLGERQEILIDGKPAPKYVADAIWPAALISAGEHEVVLRRKYPWRAFVGSALVSLAVTLWTLIDKVRRWRMGAISLRCVAPNN